MSRADRSRSTGLFASQGPRARSWWRGSVLLMLFFSNPVQAHLVSTGFGPFYDGVSHLLLSPGELLGVIGLSLLAGLQGVRPARVSLFTLPLAWMVGGSWGMSNGQELSLPMATGAGLFILGGLVAWDAPLPAWLVPALAGLFGFVHGYCDGTAAVAGGLGFSGLLGIGSTVFVLVAFAAAAAVSLARLPSWVRVVARAAGSWLAAIGLLMIGWALR